MLRDTTLQRKCGYTCTHTWVSHGVESCRSFLRPVDGDGNLAGGGTQAFIQVSVSGELGYCCSLDPHLQQPQARQVLFSQYCCHFLTQNRHSLTVKK